MSDRREPPRSGPAAQVVEASVEAAAAFLADAEREVETYLAGLGSTHRDAAREAAGKHRTAAIEDIDDVVGKVDQVLGDLVAVLQLQAISTTGAVLPSQDRRYLGNEYANHRCPGSRPRSRTAPHGSPVTSAPPVPERPGTTMAETHRTTRTILDVHGLRRHPARGEAARLGRPRP